MTLVEINFDGIVGPSHNYAGLSLGNLAASAHAGEVSYPRAAALQGLDKMRGNRELGLAQGFFVPLPRPNHRFLSAIGADAESETEIAVQISLVVGGPVGHVLQTLAARMEKIAVHGRSVVALLNQFDL